MKEFKSFFKTVGGNEGSKCRYTTRLDTYGCGCIHNCSYCYARSLLEFRGFWHPEEPAVANIAKVERKIQMLPPYSIVRLGGMTDCFQPIEHKQQVTLETIKLLNEYKIHYLIVTKSDLVATDTYMKAMDENLAHIQITITSTDDDLASTYECATPPSRRIVAIEKLFHAGYDVQVRISPFIPQFLDFGVVNEIKCNKALVEFLRTNAYIKTKFNIDYSDYTHKESGYLHLPLSKKIELLRNINGFRDISVCEDCSEAYEFWKMHVNPNANDCCNLRF